MSSGYSPEELKGMWTLADTVLRNGDTYYICMKLIDIEFEDIKKQETEKGWFLFSYIGKFWSFPIRATHWGSKKSYKGKNEKELRVRFKWKVLFFKLKWNWNNWQYTTLVVLFIIYGYKRYQQEKVTTTISLPTNRIRGNEINL